MQKRVLYTIFLLAILSLTLLVKNNFELSYYFDFMIPLNLAKITFLVGVLAIGTYAFTKVNRGVLTKLMLCAFGLCFVLNLYLFSWHIRLAEAERTLSEYYELKDATDVENRFAEDVRNKEMKYFQFGMGPNIQLSERLHSLYDIESYSMGCVVLPLTEYYNQLVHQYLEKEFNSSLEEIYADLEK